MMLPVRGRAGELVVGDGAEEGFAGDHAAHAFGLKAELNVGVAEKDDRLDARGVVRVFEAGEEAALEDFGFVVGEAEGRLEPLAFAAGGSAAPVDGVAFVAPRSALDFDQIKG